MSGDDIVSCRFGSGGGVSLERIQRRIRSKQRQALVVKVSLKGDY